MRKPASTGVSNHTLPVDLSYEQLSHHVRAVECVLRHHTIPFRDVVHQFPQPCTYSPTALLPATRLTPQHDSQASQSEGWVAMEVVLEEVLWLFLSAAQGLQFVLLLLG